MPHLSSNHPVRARQKHFKECSWGQLERWVGREGWRRVGEWNRSEVFYSYDKSAEQRECLQIRGNKALRGYTNTYFTIKVISETTEHTPCVCTYIFYYGCRFEIVAVMESIFVIPFSLSIPSANPLHPRAKRPKLDRWSLIHTILISTPYSVSMNTYYAHPRLNGYTFPSTIHIHRPSPIAYHHPRVDGFSSACLDVCM